MFVGSIGGVEKGWGNKSQPNGEGWPEGRRGKQHQEGHLYQLKKGSALVACKPLQ